MNSEELEKRYRSKIRFWYERFTALSDITDKLQTELEKQKVELERQKELVEKVVNENVQVIKELEKLKEKETEMSFSDLSLEK